MTQDKIQGPRVWTDDIVFFKWFATEIRAIDWTHN